MEDFDKKGNATGVALACSGVPNLYISLCLIRLPRKVGSFTKGAKRRTPRIRVCVQIDAMLGVMYAVTHVGCFQREGWKEVIYNIESPDIFLSQRYIRVHKPSG